MDGVTLPEGYTVERDEQREYLRPERQGKLREVTFRVRDADGDEVAKPQTYYRGRDGWVVNVGTQRNGLDPDEARARAAALIMAADECDRLRTEDG